MRTPDFLVVGAARAGTTSLHSYLRQHPEIFLPRLKEPCFFAFEGEEKKMKKGKFSFAIRKFEDYRKLFLIAEQNQRIGEMSTPYLYLYDRSIATMKKYFVDYPEIKIVILLRDPAERAYSQYMWRLRDGREPLSFQDAIRDEKERMKSNFSFDYFYVDRGFYFRQVKAYLENFKNVRIVLFEDFIADPILTLKGICRFIGVSDTFDFIVEKRENESSVPRWKPLSKIITAESSLKYKLWFSLPDSLRKDIRRLFSRANEKKGGRMVMNDATRNSLIETYREDVLALQKLINRDLSAWIRQI